MYEVLSLSELENPPDDLGSMFTHIFKLVEWKYIVFVFIGYIMLNTTTFVDRVLNGWDNAVEGRFPTEKGLMIQALILSISLMMFCIFSNSGMI